MMAYEGQIAGVGNTGRSPRQAVVRQMQRRSAAELAERRAAVVAAVRTVADLEFVNGGGTGSLETTAAEDSQSPKSPPAQGFSGLACSITTALSGREHAAFFVMPVVRKPSRSVATLLGGGWIASGPVGRDRLPVIADPPGLRYVDIEGAGRGADPAARPAGRIIAGRPAGVAPTRQSR